MDEVTLVVPMDDGGEVALMRALSTVVDHFGGIDFGQPTQCDAASIGRAVDWLHAKYGNRRTPDGGK